MTDKNIILKASIQFLKKGFSVIPCNADKKPSIPSWKQYQTKLMPQDEAATVFLGAQRIAIICGAVSGNLECLDFDDSTAYIPFLEMLAERDPFLPNKLAKRKTPSGGYHIVYRCVSPVAGNQKLACKMVMDKDGKEKEEVRIETRGQGGYHLAPPSPGYEVIERGFKEIAVLSAEDVALIHGTARMFDLRPVREENQAAKSKDGKVSDDSPGNRFKRDNNITDMLIRYGWKPERKTTAGQGWTRPGKENGCSGVLLDNSGNFYVWSSNASPLEPNRSYDAFGLFTMYEHGGDFTKAAKVVQGCKLVEHKTLFDLSRLTIGSDIASGEYQINYLVDKLIPDQAVILFYAKGGAGKSTLATQIAGAVVDGQPFMGLASTKRPVVIVDYENPNAVLKKRIKVLPGSEQVYFWTGSNNPPQLNQKEWADLKALVITLGRPLIILDTLSSSTSGLDILSNGDYSKVMSKILELRNLGATIVLLHHTPKGDATQYIGASAIYNQCDHILAMYPVKSPGAETEVNDEDEAKIYRLGTKDKTRFEPFSMFVEFDEEHGAFALARDPDSDTLVRIAQIIKSLQPSATQTAIVSAAKEQSLPEKKTRRLLHLHEGREWIMTPGTKNAKIYSLNSAWQFGNPIYRGQTAKQEVSLAECFAKQGQTAFSNESEPYAGTGLGSLASSVSPECQTGNNNLPETELEVIEI